MNYDVKLGKNGEIIQVNNLKVGDKVIYKKWGGNEFKIGDTEYQFLKFEDILAVIND